MNVLDLLATCQQAYVSPSFTAGPDGRDAALVTRLATGETILSFRGTETTPSFCSVLDWVNDLHADLVAADGFQGRVHAGFLASLNDLWEGVVAALEAPADKGLPWAKNLYITGHSKGGALAILAGVRLAALKPRVVTFAAPKVGNRRFSALYPLCIQVAAYEGADDIVPLLPPFGYSTTGTVIEQDGMSPHLRHLRIDELIVEGCWGSIVAAHHLSAYRAWISRLPPHDTELRPAA